MIEIYYCQRLIIAGLVNCQCGYPGAPAHSSVQFSGSRDELSGEHSVASIAEYTCDRGFELLGPARRVCGENGTWSPQGIPFCGKYNSGIATLN